MVSSVFAEVHHCYRIMSPPDPKDASVGGPANLKSQEKELPPSSIPPPKIAPPGQSKISSREGSPVRRAISALQVVSQDDTNRPRKNSTEFSPTRSSVLGNTFQSTPSAAAIQRTLSAQRPLSQPRSVDGVIEGVKEEKANKDTDRPHWPISPRLKSPPPSNAGSRIPALKRTENDNTSSLAATSKRIVASSAPDLLAQPDRPDVEIEQPIPRSAVRAGRIATGPASVLETVAEASVPEASSVPEDLPTIQKQPETKATPSKPPSNEPPSKTKEISGVGSGSESGGKDSGKSKMQPLTKITSAVPSRPSGTLAKKSSTNFASNKNQKPDPPRMMTVETETVTSNPQNPIGGPGSVRLKPSSETIRPKKDKKKSTRRPAALNSGTLTSKADIFEAKVASAVDDADDSDSDETFVYESNPPEAHGAKHHSRTPSATSQASFADQYGSRYNSGYKDRTQSIAGKRSMKFTNANHNLDGDFGSGRGSGRSNSGTPRHHQIHRHIRAGHPSLFDQDSPFGQNKPSSPRSSMGTVNRISRPDSPRLLSGKSLTSPRKNELYIYDADEDRADDERTPLIGSVRIRNRHARRPNSGSIRQIEYYEGRQRSCWSRYGACIVVAVLLLVVCIGAGTFAMALNKSLIDVQIKHIQNVLASEQELMLDLHVTAINPNLFAITVNDLDINMFAKSGYVGTTSIWRDTQGSSNTSLWMSRRAKMLNTKADSQNDPLSTQDGVDKGTDPIDDPEGDPQTMLLGRVFMLDSPLIFEPSPVRRSFTSAVGELRLAKPGNKTEEGGSARWERVIQHPFELIVRGIIKYQLPISSSTRTASIGSRMKVYPKDDSDADHKV